MKLRANAKINLTLDICGKREDGYHLLDSIMQSISLCDIVTVDKSVDITVNCSDSSLGGEQNIAIKAAKKFFEFTGIKGGADIYIEKNIPKAAGLGGGSADAAAVIVGLNEVYQTELDTTKLCDIGLSVGADVPFCIVGGTARVSGIGECIKSIEPMPYAAFVLSLAGEKQSTADMYRKIDNDPLCWNICSTPDMLVAIGNGDIAEVSNKLSNVFATVCEHTALKTVFQNTHPLGVSLSGSGPTVFAVYGDLPSAQTAQRQLEKENIKAYIAETADKGIEIE